MTEETSIMINHEVKEGVTSVEEPKKEEKITSIMEAANALTALGDEDEAATDAAAANVITNVEHHGEQPVDKPTGEDPSSLDKPVPVSVKDQPKDSLSSTTDQPPTATTTVPQQQKPTISQSHTEDNTVTSTNSGTNSKRYLPEHKKPDAALTFPEKMMVMMRFVDENKDDPNYCAAWMDDGKSFIVRNPDEFARQVVPKFFKPTKFSSFTRKLYRWGFRQINRGIGPDDPVIFGNDYFERDNEALMSQMRSITAAGTRKSESRMIGATSHHHNMYGKRPFDGVNHNIYDAYAEQQKRYLYEQFMHQQKSSAQMMQQQHNQPMYGGMSTNGPMHMNQYPIHGGGIGGSMMDSGYPATHHMLPHIGGKAYDMMPSMHPDGSSQSMMMNMGYNPMQQQQQLHPQSSQQQQGGASMMSSNLASPLPGGMGGNLPQQHMGQGMGGPMIGPTQPPGGGGGGSGGPSSQGGYLSSGNGGVGASSGGSGNQNTSEIVNAAIRALHYSA